jgi:hypothetical protein
MFKTPILVIAYNRVEFTHDLFTTLHALQPEKLYVSVDGAAPDDRVDYRKTLEVQCVFACEWPCELHTNFNAKHLGKSKHVVSAINWFFENESEGIILFDDTIPHPDFFPYCEELLEKYRDNQKVGHIGGCNILKKKSVESSYYFSAYPTVWGFATWRDRWQGFDIHAKEVSVSDFPDIFAPYTVKRKVPNFWMRRFKLITQYPDIDIWEYQYFIHLWKKQCFSIIPDTNLIENRGFSSKSKRKLRRLNRPTLPILPIVHNTEFVQNEYADRYIFRRYFRKDKLTFLRRWIDDNILIND